MRAFSELMLAKALAFHAAGLAFEARGACQAVLDRDPFRAEAWGLLGAIALAAGRADEAAAACRRALVLAPDGVAAWTTLCGAAAMPIAGAAAVRLAPASAAAHYNLATALLRAERPAAAVWSYRRALALEPERAAAWDHLGTAHYYTARPALALAAFDRALAIEPTRPATLWNRAQALLISGRLREGFALYERRWSVLPPAARPVRPSPLWDGGALDGRTLLLVAEQAFGDVLNFARYVPLARARGGRVVLEARPPLLPLFADWPGADAVIPAGQPVPHDVHLPFMSLPHVLGIGDGDHLAGSVPYLSLPATARIKAPDGEGPAVGLVWSGRQSPGNLRRSCPAAALTPLLALPGLRFVSAQVDASAEDLALLAAHGVKTPNEDIRDFADLAGLLAGLDLLLTIDSAPAHLAGAMGLPVWTMLAHGADWRWFLDRADSPWYPTMRLFRQRREGDWAGLVEDVAAALTEIPQASWSSAKPASEFWPR